MSKSYEERIDELQKRIEEMSNLRRELQTKAKIQARKDRTRRLIRLGGVLEAAVASVTDDGDEMVVIDPEILAIYLASPIRTGSGEEHKVIEIQMRYYEKTRTRIEQERAAVQAEDHNSDTSIDDQHNDNPSPYGQ